MIEIHGSLVDEQTRCVHYNTPLDVVAIKFKCCGRYYACYLCHAKSELHDVTCWNIADYARQAIFCGVCKVLLTIEEYLSCGFSCPSCRSSFNSGCAKHYDIYFELARSLPLRRQPGWPDSIPATPATLCVIGYLVKVTLATSPSKKLR